MAANQATNGVSSSSHMTELTDQVIETLLVSDFSDEVNLVGLQCLLHVLVKLSSVSSSASKSAMDTVISLLPQFTGEWSDTRAPVLGWPCSDYDPAQVSVYTCYLMLWLS